MIYRLEKGVVYLENVADNHLRVDVQDTIKVLLSCVLDTLYQTWCVRLFLHPSPA